MDEDGVPFYYKAEELENRSKLSPPGSEKPYPASVTRIRPTAITDLPYVELFYRARCKGEYRTGCRVRHGVRHGKGTGLYGKDKKCKRFKKKNSWECRCEVQ